MADREGEDPNVFAISIEQAVEYTATRVRPTKLISGMISQNQQFVQLSDQHQPASINQNDAIVNPNKLRSLKLFSPEQNITQIQPYNTLSPPIFPPLIRKGATPRSPYLRHASIIPPHRMQEIRVKNPKLYSKILSRNLNFYKDPVVGPDAANHSPRSRINRPKTPTCPPLMTKEQLSKHDVTAQLFCHRQACAARLLGELEENGWVCWEREVMDTNAIERDFDQDSRDNGIGVNLDEYIKLQDAVDTRRAEAARAAASQAREATTMLGHHHRLRPSSALRIVRYTDQDEAEEPEPEDERPASYGEKRAKAVKQAKRDQNKRVALFLADMMIEDMRIQRMGF